MSNIQITLDWVEKTLKPSIGIYMYIHSAVNEMAKESHSDTGNIDPRKILKSAMRLPLLGLLSILEILHLQLQQTAFIGGFEPNEVDREAFYSIHNAVSKGILNISEDHLIHNWYQQCEGIFSNIQ